MNLDGSPDPLLTLVICARNDRHAGNALWRLQTTLNFLSVSAHESLGCNQVEVIVCDWGSQQPLREVLKLLPRAAAMVRFLEVPPALAAEKQQDSPFCEVIANNSSIRRARGRYIGRIDQDTLVGTSFLSGFSNWVGGQDPAKSQSCFMFIGRRSIPQSFVEKDPGFSEVCSIVGQYGSRLPREGLAQRPWFDAPVGVAILHRDLWQACRGYDERLIYWGFMETDLALRIASRHDVVDLEEILGCDFYHLAHGGRSFRSTSRVKNPRIRPKAFAPGDSQWGLDDYELEFRQAPAADPDSPDIHPAGKTASLTWSSLAAEWGWQALCGAMRLIRGIFKGDRIRTETRQ